MIPTTEEIQLIAEKAKGMDFELPFLLAAWMGLRTSEIRGLTWDYVDNEPVLKSTKTYSGDRKIKIPTYIKKLIEEQEKTDQSIIHSSRNSLYKHFQRMCKRCGLPHYRFHDLRHYQASVMLALGVPDKYAMERMGHASTNMLKNVYHQKI